MLTWLLQSRLRYPFKLAAAFIMISFVASGMGIYARAETLPYLPAPGNMITTSSAFSPVLLKGVIVDSDNPFKLKFILDEGDTKLSDSQLKEETNILVRYFLSALTIPASDMWVNLSPYEKESVVPQEFGLTDIGRDMLAQDYILKQLSASLTYPDSPLGKEYWDNIHKKSQALYGTTNVPVSTFHKIWIVPNKATVLESGLKAYITESSMKVMLEEDYKAKSINNAADQKDISMTVVRETIIPAIEKDVNTGKNFAYLRQMQNAIILAMWFKNKLKTSIYNQLYIDKKKIAGVNTNDPGAVDKIYNQYVDAFKQGVYNYSKRDFNPASQRIISRRYYSGGIILPKQPDVVDANDGQFGAAVGRASVAAIKVDATGESEQVAARSLSPEHAAELNALAGRTTHGDMTLGSAGDVSVPTRFLPALLVALGLGGAAVVSHPADAVAKPNRAAVAAHKGIEADVNAWDEDTFQEVKGEFGDLLSKAINTALSKSQPKNKAEAQALREKLKREVAARLIKADKSREQYVKALLAGGATLVDKDQQARNAEIARQNIRTDRQNAIVGAANQRNHAESVKNFKDGMAQLFNDAVSKNKQNIATLKSENRRTRGLILMADGDLKIIEGSTGDNFTIPQGDLPALQTFLNELDNLSEGTITIPSNVDSQTKGFMQARQERAKVLLRQGDLEIDSTTRINGATVKKHYSIVPDDRPLVALFADALRKDKRKDAQDIVNGEFTSEETRTFLKDKLAYYDGIQKEDANPAGVAPEAVPQQQQPAPTKQQFQPTRPTGPMQMIQGPVNRFNGQRFAANRTNRGTDRRRDMARNNSLGTGSTGAPGMDLADTRAYEIAANIPAAVEELAQAMGAKKVQRLVHGELIWVYDFKAALRALKSDRYANENGEVYIDSDTGFLVIKHKDIKGGHIGRGSYNEGITLYGGTDGDIVHESAEVQSLIEYLVKKGHARENVLQNLGQIFDDMLNNGDLVVWGEVINIKWEAHKDGLRKQAEKEGWSTSKLSRLLRESDKEKSNDLKDAGEKLKPRMRTKLGELLAEHNDLQAKTAVPASESGTLALAVRLQRTERMLVLTREIGEIKDLLEIWAAEPSERASLGTASNTSDGNKPPTKGGITEEGLKLRVNSDGSETPVFKNVPLDIKNFNGFGFQIMAIGRNRTGAEIIMAKSI